MKITGFEIFDCDLGWRTISFLKLSADDGTTGWSEFNESFGNKGLSAVVATLKDFLIGQDPRDINPVMARLAVYRLPASGGMNRQALAAVENALYDLAARSLGVSVATLLGGALRSRIPVYWSHCGSYRLGEHTAQLVGKPLMTSYADVEELGREVVASGFTGLKTNVIAFDDPEIQTREAGWGRLSWVPGRAWDNRLIDAAVRTIEAFRAGAGDSMSIHLDVNFGYLADGYRRVARALEGLDLAWLELDGLDPAALAALRASVRLPIASLESVFEVKGYAPFFSAGAVDVAIVDVIWNGIGESLRIAQLASTYSVSVAPHNFYGPLGDVMSANFSALSPNFSVMEIDGDGVAWRNDFLVNAPLIENGELVLPTGPGWGVDINEEVVREHRARSA